VFEEAGSIGSGLFISRLDPVDLPLQLQAEQTLLEATPFLAKFFKILLPLIHTEA
jgi:hypothetical protein